MTQEEYNAVCERITKAESLPEEQLEKFRDLYEKLMLDALTYEQSNGLFPAHLYYGTKVRDLIVACWNHRDSPRDFATRISGLLMLDHVDGLKALGCREVTDDVT